MSACKCPHWSSVTALWDLTSPPGPDQNGEIYTNHIPIFFIFFPYLFQIHIHNHQSICTLYPCLNTSFSGIEENLQASGRRLSQDKSVLSAEGPRLNIILALSRRHIGEELSEEATGEAATILGTSPPRSPGLSWLPEQR